MIVVGRPCPRLYLLLSLGWLRIGSPTSRYPEPSGDLLSYLAQVPDPRDCRGRWHELPGLLAVAVCAVLAGAKSLAAIGEWAADAPAAVLRTLGDPR
jgi:DDE_Tnp_1-associated